MLFFIFFLPWLNEAEKKKKEMMITNRIVIGRDPTYIRLINRVKMNCCRAALFDTHFRSVLDRTEKGKRNILKKKTVVKRSVEVNIVKSGPIK